MNRQRAFSGQLNSTTEQPLTQEELRDALPPSEERINLVEVCRQILRIVARLETTPYTASIECQTVERELDDPANPASEGTTPQG
jgi:hypothetical protein